MNIEEVMQNLNKLEKEKAQLELLAQQLKDEKATLEKRMKEAGVTRETIDGKISELEKAITDQLQAIRDGQTAGKKTIEEMV